MGLPAAAVAVEEKQEVDHTNPEGYLVMASKKERSEEAYLVGTKGKKNKKNLPPKEDAGSSAADKKRPIKHTAQTLGIFSQLKVPAPVTTADLPDLIAKLTASL